MSIRDRIAFLTSFVFSPFLVPIATVWIVVHKYADTRQQAFVWAAIVVISVSILPALFIWAMFQLGRVSDLHLAVKEQRVVPLSFGLASALIGTAILYRIAAYEGLVWAAMAYCINGVIFVLITPYWKISFHSGTAAGCITVLMLLVDAQFSWLFLLIPLIGWARVHRKRHTILQTAVGALLSFANTAAVLRLALRL